MEKLGPVPELSLRLCHDSMHNISGHAPVGDASLGLYPGHYTLLASETKWPHPKSYPRNSLLPSHAQVGEPWLVPVPLTSVVDCVSMSGNVLWSCSIHEHRHSLWEFPDVFNLSCDGDLLPWWLSSVNMSHPSKLSRLKLAGGHDCQCRWPRIKLAPCFMWRTADNLSKRKKQCKISNCLHTSISSLRVYCPWTDTLESLTSSNTTAHVSAHPSVL